MREPTTKQSKMLAFMASFASEHGYPATVREIGAHMGVKSTNAVGDMLNSLGRKGMIVRSTLHRARATILTEAGKQYLERRGLSPTPPPSFAAPAFAAWPYRPAR